MKKIIIRSQDYLRFVTCSEIAYCKSDNCYTTLFLDTGEEIVICKSLKLVSQELNMECFIRVNQSYLINKEYIRQIDKKNKCIQLTGGHQIPFTTTLSDLLSMITSNASISMAGIMQVSSILCLW